MHGGQDLCSLVPPDRFPPAHVESRVGIQWPEAEGEVGTGGGCSVIC